MSAELLREAAALMRQRAQEATSSPWAPMDGAFGDPTNGPDHMRVVQEPYSNALQAVARLEYNRQGGADAEHIASWHPAVALAVADWLDQASGRVSTGPGECGDDYWDAVAVALAYLGRSDG